ncbi:MAG: NrsF family protein [Bdellovibrionota bacterium]
MKTDDLISKLSSEHKRVEVLPPFWKRYLRWSLISVLCVFTGVSLVGIREDWVELFKSTSMLLQNLAILLGALLASALALLLSVPGSEKNKLLRYLVPLPFVLWAIVLLVRGLEAPSFYPGIAMGCAAEIFSLGFIPGILLLVIVRRGATLHRGKASFFVFMAAAALGAFGAQFSCHNDDPFHLLFWHFMPVLIIGILGVALAKKLLKKV